MTVTALLPGFFFQLDYNSLQISPLTVVSGTRDLRPICEFGQDGILSGRRSLDEAFTVHRPADCVGGNSWRNESPGNNVYMQSTLMFLRKGIDLAATIESQISGKNPLRHPEGSRRTLTA
jgi:hypothetical protein